MASMLFFAVLCCVRAEEINLYFTWNIRGEIRSSLASADSGQDTGTSAWLNTWSALATIGLDSNTLLIDLGNTYYPGFLSRFSYGSVTNELLNLAGFDGKRVTPRDFSQGTARLADLQAKANFPFLGANIVNRETNEPFFVADTTLRANGAAIRFIAAAALQKHHPAPADMARTLRINDPAAAIQARLAAQPPVDSVVTICLIDNHTLERGSGLLEFEGVDLLVCGIPDYTAASGSHVREERRANGVRVVYVPGISKGVGRLRLQRSQQSWRASYSVDSLARVPAVSYQVSRIQRLVDKWTALYSAETSGIIARMDEPLESNHGEAVAGLLRERFGVELACIEEALINPASLPETVTMHDLDRLLTSSPDMYIAHFRGKRLYRLRGLQTTVFSGFDGGKIQGRSIQSDEVYSVALTENVINHAREEGIRPVRMPVLAYESVFEALRKQLRKRKKRVYDFAHLERKWRFAGETNLQGSRRSVRTAYPDSSMRISGFSSEPYSAWDFSLRLNLRFYNRMHHFELKPRLEYAAANERTGRNLMEYRLDYTPGPMPLVKPYASTSYQTFVTADTASPNPVAIRSTAGAQFTPRSWRFKIGFGAEKTIRSSNANPFNPFVEVFQDTAATWGPGVELLAEGSVNISRLLERFNKDYFAHRAYSLRILWESYFSYLGEQRTFKSHSRIEPALTAGLLPNFEVRLGLRLLHAHFFDAPDHFYNIEPSLSLSGTYRLKW